MLLFLKRGLFADIVRRSLGEGGSDASNEKPRSLKTTACFGVFEKRIDPTTTVMTNSKPLLKSNEQSTAQTANI